MNISEEAVEAAAERLHLRRRHVAVWGLMIDSAKAECRAEARAALEAAAPLLMAQAWGEGWEAAAGWPQEFDNPYRP